MSVDLTKAERLEELSVAPDRRAMTLGFADGARFRLDAELLRVESPSAEVRGHGSDERVWLGGKARVVIEGIEPVGNYALKIRFDDGHDTGLYGFGFLRRLAEEREARFDAYVEALAERGLAREPR